ncbi:hypothetical protein DOY81_006847 [Sarcophaga bullata]|nr:hypothetical protein DOY81_006847 [Sarcophaga bullata]
MAKRARDLEEVKKRKMARLRFGNLIRSVVINRIWLVDAGDQKFSLNVKKNISMLVRTQIKIGLLTMAEKSLIRTSSQQRTIEDRKKLVSLMAGLNCFSKIPPKVRARLARCVKFMVIGPGRTLIKEGDMPMMVYFLLTGEVEASQRAYNHIQNTWVSKIKAIHGPGDCLGDVEMIERCVRRHTYTSTNVVELLVVFEEDFEKILRPVMEQQWIDKRNAIMALDYFKLFTKDQITNACKLCVLRQFEPLETIYYEDKGQLSYVHFVISGECMILQCLQMMVSQRKGVKNFHLTNITKEGASSMFQNLTDTQLLQILKTEDTSTNKNVYDIDQLIASDENIRRSTKKYDTKNVDIKKIERKCGLIPSSSSESEDFTTVNGSEQSLASIMEEEPEFEVSEEESLQELQQEINDKTNLENDNLAGKIGGRGGETGNIDQQRVNQNESNPISKSPKDRKASESVINEDLQENRSSMEKETATKLSKLQTLHQSLRESFPRQSSYRSSFKPPVGKIENHFIDVGSLTFGGIFGLGEKLEHRVIMARTTVQCLMIPRFWLLEKDQNPGNIWQRRRFYLESTIPSRQTLFNDFLNTRQWQKFKTNLIQSHLNPDSISNPTHVQDIPIICRIVEASDE